MAGSLRTRMEVDCETFAGASFHSVGAVAVVVPGCSDRVPCDPGQVAWLCNIPPTAGCNAFLVKDCGATKADALVAAIPKAIAMQPTLAGVLTHVDVCTPLNSTSYDPNPDTMGFPPSCDASAGDTACVACAKAFCCGDYQACPMDTNCSCLVGCLYMGGTLSTCATENGCGPPSDVSIATSACLSGGCPACASMGDMASGMCAQPTGVGVGVSTGTGAGGGSSTPACTPGSAGAGESCLSDADCASCVCNNDSCN